MLSTLLPRGDAAPVRDKLGKRRRHCRSVLKRKHKMYPCRSHRLFGKGLTTELEPKRISQYRSFFWRIIGSPLFLRSLRYQNG